MQKEDKRVVVLPLDGFKTSFVAMARLEESLNTSANEIISHIKLNDVLHFGGPSVVAGVIDVLRQYDLHGKIKIFLDLKLADTKGTNKNIVSLYAREDIRDYIDIITVRACTSFDGVIAVKDVFPEAKIALVSVLTDMSTEECLNRHDRVPGPKIASDIIFFEEWARDLKQESPFDAVVCSPAEVAFLKNGFPEYQYIVPGIRNDWMASGQQDSGRLTGVNKALRLGADLLVVGSQLTRGNPQNEISAEKSCQMTVELIHNHFDVPF